MNKKHGHYLNIYGDQGLIVQQLGPLNPEALEIIKKLVEPDESDPGTLFSYVVLTDLNDDVAILLEAMTDD